MILSYSKSLDANIWILVDAISWLSVGLSLALQKLDVRLVNSFDFVVESFDHFLWNFVWRKGYSKIIRGVFEHLFQFVGNVFVDVVHAEVQVFELRVLDSYPFLNGLTIWLLSSDLFDIIKLWNWLFWFLLRSQFFVFLLNRCLLFKFSKLLLNLIFWERKSSEKFERRKNILSAQTELRKTKIFNNSVGG